MYIIGKKVIIFDFDGVLFDTDRANRTILGEIIEQQLGEKLTDAEYRKFFFGQSLTRGVSDYLHSKGRPEFAVKIIDLKKGSDDRYLELIEPYEDALEIIGNLKKANQNKKQYILCIGSNARRSQIRAALKKVNLYDDFDLIVSAEDVPEKSAKSAIYQKAVDLFDMVDPHAFVVIEDSQAGIDAAKKVEPSGLYAIAVTHARKKQELRHADAVIDDLTVLQFYSPEGYRHLQEGE